ncbi:uncharacterized protein LOC126841654 isoform X2 [Adelges cooleyi]|uniref:uncharacterized protein LOC126841654 isoform X2 n=1 Tax=Adelges cooleyi TaxID=133065 RepID=UPI002180469B|nr:uncharacterized protein LOC126841654 isoform X2 [Adelges cooleyi]
MSLKFFTLLVFTIVAASCNTTDQNEAAVPGAPDQISTEAEPNQCSSTNPDQPEKKTEPEPKTSSCAKPDQPEETTAARLENEKKVIKNSFDDVRQWLGEPYTKSETISVMQFWMYMGKSAKDRQIVNAYLDTHPACKSDMFAIDVHVYGELLKNHCAQSGPDDLATFAANKKTHAVVQTPDMYAFWGTFDNPSYYSDDSD